MAARRRRKWIAIGGATAAVAIGACGAVALGAPSGLAVAQPVTRLAPHLTWTDSDAATVTSYDVQRTGASCTGFTGAVGSPTAAAFDDTTLTADGTYCYQVVSHYTAAPDVTSGTASVLYDTTPPAVHISSPVAGLVRGNVQIVAAAPDAGSGLASLTVSVDGVIQPAPSPLAWNTAVLGG